MTVRNSTDYECGDGWRNLVDTAIDQMLAIDSSIEIDRVRTHYGNLKIYYHPFNAGVDGIVRLTEEISATTCEACGSGNARIQKVQGLSKTRCAKCVSMEKKQN